RRGGNSRRNRSRSAPAKRATNCFETRGTGLCSGARKDLLVAGMIRAAQCIRIINTNADFEFAILDLRSERDSIRRLSKSKIKNPESKIDEDCNHRAGR